MNQYLKALQGITYPEWVKLRTGIDRAFEHQRRESEKTLKFTDNKIVNSIIQSQFGQRQD